MLVVAWSKSSDSGERCEVKKAMKSRGITSHRSPLSERLEQAMLVGAEAIAVRAQPSGKGGNIVSLKHYQIQFV